MRILIAITLLLFTVIGHAKPSVTYCQNQLLANPTGTGYTWTLTSRVAQALKEAEKHYGKRDKSWTILGVEFTSKGQPQVWYPYSGDNEKFIIVQLTQQASCNDKEALFQLSHEVIHLLSPAGGEKTTVLEEGLATYFSIQFVRQQGYEISADYIGSPSYRAAYDAVLSLYESHEDADKLIELLRLEYSTLSQLSKQQIMQVITGIDESLAERLAAKFKQ